MPRPVRSIAVAAVLSLAALGCAGTITVRPASPPLPPAGNRPARVSLYLDPAIAASRIVSRSPTGDVGLGDVTVAFDIGAPLAETIAGAASAVFAEAERVDAPHCAANTVAILEATLPTAPYAQVHWRDETPRVGGGTVAEILVRVVYRDCAGTEIARAVAYGFGDAQHSQAGANWPDEEDFSPGMAQALTTLRANLMDLFRDIGTGSASS